MLLGLFATFSVIVPEVSAYTGSYDETFIDDTYIDEMNTNVTGLGTGEISLPKRGLELYGLVEASPTGFMGHELEIIGDIAYVAAFENLHLYNISDVTNPTWLSMLAIHDVSPSCSMAIVDDILYLPTHEGLDIINVSDSLNPEFLVGYAWVGVTSHVIVQDNIAFVTGGNNGLVILNVTDPVAATSIANYTDLAESPRSFDIMGERMYVADRTEFHVVNLTDIYNPTQIIRVPTIVGGWELEVEGDLLIVRPSGPLMFYDISTPENPVSIYNSTFNVMRITIDSNKLYGYGPGQELSIFDITNPGSPTELYRHPYNGTYIIQDIELSGDYIYVTDGLPFIQVFRYKDSTGFYWNQYALSAVIQTNPLFTSNDLDSIVDVTLQVDDSTPSNTAIDYYVSASNGSWWAEADPGIKQSVGAYRGQQMKWRAELSTSDRSVTPTIQSVNATCTALLDKIHSTAPELGATLDDNTPLFTWIPIEGAESYLLQIDTTQDFDSSNLISVTIPGTWSENYQLVEPLSDGDWAWQVAGIDSEGQLGEFSPASPFTIDTGAGTGTGTGTGTNPLPIPEDLLQYLLIGGVAIAVIAIVIVTIRRK